MRIRRRMERERFVLPDGASFYDLYEKRNEANIGELINVALEKIEDANSAKLEGVFRNIDFNSEVQSRPPQGSQPPAQEPAGRLQQARARPAALARHRGHHRRVLHLPDFALRLRRRQEGRRVLHAGRGIEAAGQAGRPEAWRHDLRPGLRLRLAADPRRRSRSAPTTSRSTGRKSTARPGRWHA